MGLRRFLSPVVFLPLLVLVYGAVCFSTLQKALDHPDGRADFLSGDAKAYLAVARLFADGDFSMDYVKGRPHRQPLYPAALAVAMRVKGEDYFWLATVNIVVAVAGLILLYLAVLGTHGSPGVAAAVGVLYAVNPFVLRQSAEHFMTEPMHITLMIGVIFCFLGYLRQGRPWQLLAAVALTGLDYLTRPNGLFVMISLVAALGLREVVLALRARPERSELLRRAGLYALAGLVFVVVTIPTWVPRAQHFGRPIYHGYLSNFLWVDTYEQGRSDAVYTWRDYVATHTLGDAVRRGFDGAWNVAVRIPTRMERVFPALSFFALVGLLVALVRGPLAYRIFVVFGLIQLLPLMWTNLSNPNVRVPYASVMPIQLALAAFGLAFVRDLALRTAGRLPRIGNPRPTATAEHRS